MDLNCMNLAEWWPDVIQMEGWEGGVVQYALFGYTGESKCVRCQKKATQVITQPVFKLECLRPKRAQRGHLNLDVQTDTGITIHGRPETFGRPGQVDNLAHLKTDIL
jgi:hypothetical protein